MSNFYSPLRYPGGKNRLAPFVAYICRSNNLTERYIEPYSGGASVALSLLLEGVVNEIIINDKDRSIYAFWYSVLHYTNELCERISKCEVTVEEWYKQREIQLNKKKVDLIDLGFSTFFLNRTNRSGIISGGIIGGFSQTGKYPIDCRFNKDELIKRIRLIASKKKYIRLYTKDALKLFAYLTKRNLITDHTLIYFDPPYYAKGPLLYLNHYSNSDHEVVSNAISKIASCEWLVSYDSVPEIKTLYSNFRSVEYNLSHSAYSAKKGNEILFLSNGIKSINLFTDPTCYKMHPVSDNRLIITYEGREINE